MSTFEFYILRDNSIPKIKCQHFLQFLFSTNYNSRVDTENLKKFTNRLYLSRSYYVSSLTVVEENIFSTIRLIFPGGS